MSWVAFLLCVIAFILGHPELMLVICLFSALDSN